MSNFYQSLAVQVNSIPTFWFVLIIFALFICILVLIGSLFNDLKILRIIINTPSSKIRSAAQGYVEIKGKVASVIDFLESPLTKTKCCWYKYKVEKEVLTQDTDGNLSHKWETIDHGQSLNLLKINDGTGECLINVSHAKVEPVKHNYWIGHAMNNPNPNKSSSRINKMFQMLSSFDNTRYKYSEYIIEPDEDLYVLGFFQTVDKNLPPFKDKKSVERKRLNKQANDIKKNISNSGLSSLQGSVDIMMKDLGHSIKTVNTEWVYYANKINERQRVNYLSHRKDPCIVSTFSQKQLIKKYKSGVSLSCFGSVVAVVIFVGLMYLRVMS